MSKYEELKSIIAGMEEDLNKFNSGNASAGTRLRKALQALKKAAQEMRVEIQEKKKAG